jgi:hypothetical protein
VKDLGKISVGETSVGSALDAAKVTFLGVRVDAEGLVDVPAPKPSERFIKVREFEFAGLLGEDFVEDIVGPLLVSSANSSVDTRLPDGREDLLGCYSMPAVEDIEFD